MRGDHDELIYCKLFPLVDFGALASTYIRPLLTLHTFLVITVSSEGAFFYLGCSQISSL